MIQKSALARNFGSQCGISPIRPPRFHPFEIPKVGRGICDFSQATENKIFEPLRRFGLASALEGNAQEHFSATSIAGELFLAMQVAEQFRFRLGEKYADPLFGFRGDR